MFVHWEEKTSWRIFLPLGKGRGWTRLPACKWEFCLTKRPTGICPFPEIRPGLPTLLQSAGQFRNRFLFPIAFILFCMILCYLNLRFFFFLNGFLRDCSEPFVLQPSEVWRSCPAITCSTFNSAFLFWACPPPQSWNKSKLVETQSQ